MVAWVISYHSLAVEHVTAYRVERVTSSWEMNTWSTSVWRHCARRETGKRWRRWGRKMQWDNKNVNKRNENCITLRNNQALIAFTFKFSSLVFKDVKKNLETKRTSSTKTTLEYVFFLKKEDGCTTIPFESITAHQYHVQESKYQTLALHTFQKFLKTSKKFPQIPKNSGGVTWRKPLKKTLNNNNNDLWRLSPAITVEHNEIKTSLPLLLLQYTENNQ